MCVSDQRLCPEEYSWTGVLPGRSIVVCWGEYSWKSLRSTCEAFVRGFDPSCHFGLPLLLLEFSAPNRSSYKLPSVPRTTNEFDMIEYMLGRTGSAERRREQAGPSRDSMTNKSCYITDSRSRKHCQQRMDNLRQRRCCFQFAVLSWDPQSSSG